jgi:SmpA / OmlA family
MKYIMYLLTAVLLVGCGGGSPLTLNQANLDRVQDNMTPAQVQSILGPPTDSKTDPIPIVGGTQTTYTYRNQSSQVTVVFKNGTVTEKNGTFGP